MDTSNPAKILQQDADNEASQFISDCFGIPLIVREIVKGFSNSELLQLSLVNKQWNYITRLILRDRGNVIARIGSDFPCQSLATFVSDVMLMPMVPFSGLSIDMSHVDGCCKLPSDGTRPEPSDSVILDRLQKKYLSVKIRGSCHNYQDCPALLLVKNLLEGSCGVLEELSLALNRQLEFFQDYLQGRHFPRLKTLKMEWVINYNDDTLNFLKAFVPSAPNLQIVHLNRAINFKKSPLVEGSLARIMIPSKLNPLYVQVCKSVIMSLRLKSIEICHSHIVHNNMVRLLFNRIFPMLLQGSQKVLNTLRMDLLFALPLMCYGICLENVTELEIRMESKTNENYLKPEFCTLLKAFDFTRVFPKLNQVTIIVDWRGGGFTQFERKISEYVEQGNAVLRQTLPDRAINIKHLTTFGPIRENLWLLSHMFPHVTTISVDTTATSCELKLLDFFRMYFKSLEKVFVNNRTCSSFTLIP